MTSKEALKRLWQETAPATYMKDFDKKKCCDIIEKDLEALEVLKKYVQTATLMDNDTMVFRIDAIFMWDDADYKKIKRWMENDRTGND